MIKAPIDFIKVLGGLDQKTIIRMRYFGMKIRSQRGYICIKLNRFRGAGQLVRVLTRVIVEFLRLRGRIPRLTLS